MKSFLKIYLSRDLGAPRLFTQLDKYYEEKRILVFHFFSSCQTKHIAWSSSNMAWWACTTVRLSTSTHEATKAPEVEVTSCSALFSSRTYPLLRKIEMKIELLSYEKFWKGRKKTSPLKCNEQNMKYEALVRTYLLSYTRRPEYTHMFFLRCITLKAEGRALEWKGIRNKNVKFQKTVFCYLFSCKIWWHRKLKSRPYMYYIYV